jgi:hypothetical protein
VTPGREYAEHIEEERGKLFRLLTPDRDHYEKVGWPHDQAAQSQEEVQS